ncbi:MAG TPA: hypothetical protein VIN39_01510 [Candidatus Dormibacteraeota bacterium]
MVTIGVGVGAGGGAGGTVGGGVGIGVEVGVGWNVGLGVGVGVGLARFIGAAAEASAGRAAIAPRLIVAAISNSAPPTVRRYARLTASVSPTSPTLPAG